MKWEASEAVMKRITLPFALPTFLAVLSGGGADRGVAQDSASHTRDSGSAFPCLSLDDDSSYPLGYQGTLDRAIQAVSVGRAEPDRTARLCFYQMAAALARHNVFEDPNDAGMGQL